MRLVADAPVPVLGVNLGRLGFLAEVESPELDAALTAMAEGRATTESRSCLEVRHDGQRWAAFNDAVLARVPGALAFLGACPPGASPHDTPPNHSNRVRFDESVIPAGAALYAALALL